MERLPVPDVSSLRYLLKWVDQERRFGLRKIGPSRESKTSSEIRKTTHAGPPFHEEFAGRGCVDQRPLLLRCSQKEILMRAFFAACIAVGILWAVDVQLQLRRVEKRT